MRLGIILTSCLTISCLAFTPPVGINDVRQKLDDVMAYENSYIKNVIDNKGTWQVKYTMFTSAFNAITKKYQTVKTAGQLIASKDFRYSSTGNVEVCFNSQETITIIKDQKSIISTATPNGALAAAGSDYYIAIRDLFLQKFNLVMCMKVKEHGLDLLRYDFKPKNPEGSPYVKMSLTVDVEKKMLRRMYMEMNPAKSKEVRSTDMWVEERGKYQGNMSFSSFRARIFEKGDKLSSEFRSFKYREIKDSKPKTVRP